MRRSLILLALLGALGTFAPELLAPARALATPAQVIADCNTHGRLTRGYSVSELRAALTTLPADVKEYTDCNDVIERALLAQLGGSRPRHAAGGAIRSGASSGGSFLPAPLLVALVLLALAAVALGVVALRRRRHA